MHYSTITIITAFIGLTSASPLDTSGDTNPGFFHARRQFPGALGQPCSDSAPCPTNFICGTTIGTLDPQGLSDGETTCQFSPAGSVRRQAIPGEGQPCSDSAPCPTNFVCGPVIGTLDPIGAGDGDSVCQFSPAGPVRRDG